MNFVKDYLETHRFTVLFSGGKDSLACLLWVLDNVSRKDWNILYVEITGNTHPLCSQYVYDVCERLDVKDRLVVAKTKDFYELMNRWGPPLMFAYRWCLYQLKLKAFNKYAKPVTVDGIRRSDSKTRKTSKPIALLKIARRISVSPLVDWSKKDVLNYIKNHNIPLNPCYEIYGHSGNCVFCPYANKEHIIKTLNDPYWKTKILPILEKHKQKLVKGSIGLSVYNRWIQNSTQQILEVEG